MSLSLAEKSSEKYLELECEECLEFDWNKEEEISYIDMYYFLCEHDYIWCVFVCICLCIYPNIYMCFMINCNLGLREYGQCIEAAINFKSCEFKPRLQIGKIF